MPAEDKPRLFTSDVRPDELSSSFSVSGGNIRSMRVPITDIAPEEARGDSLEDALVIYRRFCEILTSRYGKPKRRKNRNGYYRSNFVTSQGVGVSVGGTIAHVSCVVESPEEMFIASEYARLVAKGYIVGGRVVAAPGCGWLWGWRGGMAVRRLDTEFCPPTSRITTTIKRVQLSGRSSVALTGAYAWFLLEFLRSDLLSPIST